MNMKLVTSATGTNQKEINQQTGMRCSECGCVDHSSFTDDQLKVMRRVPRLFQPLLNDCLLIRIYEINHPTSNFNPHSPLDKKIVELLPKLRNEIRQPTYQEVAEQLSKIAQVLQCGLPEESGLEQYFKILKEFPKVMLEECCEYIIQTTSYRKLPLPVDFIRHMQGSSTIHHTWLDKLESKYINYKE